MNDDARARRGTSLGRGGGRTIHKVARTGPVTTANITVRVTGNRALANYVIKSRTGKVLARAKGDVYLKIGGRWLDEESACA